MATTTTNLGLKKPATTDYYNIQDFNDNADTLDTFAGNAITTDKLINNASATAAGFALDARMGKTQGDQINTINTNLALKANDTDNSRTTTSKTVTGAINELNSNKAPLTSPNFTGTPQISSHNIVQALNGGYKVQEGNSSATVTTANNAVSVSITFPVAFSSAPFLYLTSNPSNDAGYTNVRTPLVTATGATIYVNSYLAQTVAFSWLAIGN
jgi:hypothetical protein